MSGETTSVYGGPVPIYYNYQSNYPVSSPVETKIQSDTVLVRLATLENTVESIKPRSVTPYTPTLTGMYSLAEEVATRVKDFLLGDGLKLFGAMTAVLATAAIMRKYPSTFAIPTLEGNWGSDHSSVYHGHHNW